MMMVVALSAAADRFYIGDFTISPGETREVTIVLDNEVAYTAFQTDMYLSEGLTIEQEDGDFTFGLTDRKAQDHQIVSQLQPNGSIRMMSYSPHVDAYNGNGGALVTFNLIASADFTGPATISLQNTLFTTTTGMEVQFSDEMANVTVPAGLDGDANGDGGVTIKDVTILISYLMGGNSTDINTANADVNHDGTVSIKDVTVLINWLMTGVV